MRLEFRRLVSSLTPERFISVEDADKAIAEIEGMVREAASSPARTVALAALLGVRQNLGLPLPDLHDEENFKAVVWARGARRRSPSGRLRIPRRMDGELDDG